MRRLRKFYMAEDYHQKYALRLNGSFFQEFTAMYPDLQDLVDSTAATRVNAYLYGCGTGEQLQTEIDSFGLSEEAKGHLQNIVPVGGCPVG